MRSFPCEELARHAPRAANRRRQGSSGGGNGGRKELGFSGKRGRSRADKERARGGVKGGTEHDDGRHVSREWTPVATTRASAAPSRTGEGEGGGADRWGPAGDFHFFSGL